MAGLPPLSVYVQFVYLVVVVLVKPAVLIHIPTAKYFFLDFTLETVTDEGVLAILEIV